MSNRYLCILRERPACDYAIGCGIAVLPIDADSKEDAWKEGFTVHGLERY